MSRPTAPVAVRTCNTTLRASFPFSVQNPSLADIELADYAQSMQKSDELREQAVSHKDTRTVIVEADAQTYVPIVKDLFQEYARELQVDLCFQGFEQELAELPGKYMPPSGRLFLAVQDGQPIGCVALRPLSQRICEMKRLYVRPTGRGHGLGRVLAQKAIVAGRKIGYTHMRLDTLGSMKEAIALYESLGFQRIEAYYDNPSACAIFMELVLSP